jgi:hypothetical protein
MPSFLFIVMSHRTLHHNERLGISNTILALASLQRNSQTSPFTYLGGGDCGVSSSPRAAK